MRLICTLDDQNRAYQLSTYLQDQGINNQLELVTNTDWGSHEYGNVTARIWIYEEEQLDKALEMAAEFQQNPNDPRYQLKEKKLALFGNVLKGEEVEQPETIPPVQTMQARQPLGLITMYVLFICCLLLFIGSTTSPSVKSISPQFPYVPVLSPPINKALMYDYPEAYEIIDRIISTYGISVVENNATLPEEAKTLLDKYEHTPYWKGIYEMILEHYKNPKSEWNFNAPLFEKIRQGEIWRIFTPCLLHYNLFHLFFNMIWLVVLGKQIEQHIGKGKYILLIVLVAIVSNTAQYLMSGPNFLGFSGVLCGMLAFIWVRQKKAAWEGYMIESSTITFFAFFILFMFFLQIVSFFLEAHAKTSLPIGIANTAHLAGAFTGYVLANMHFFSWKEAR